MQAAAVLPRAPASADGHSALAVAAAGEHLGEPGSLGHVEQLVESWPAHVSGHEPGPLSGLSEDEAESRRDLGLAFAV